MPIKRKSCLFHTYPLVLFLLIAAMASCQLERRKYLIRAEDLVDVIVDIHLADAIALENQPRYTGFTLDSAALYQSVFNKHGVTRAMFDSTISYYSGRPEEFQAIYTRVTARLNLMIEEEMNAPPPEPETLQEDLIWQASTIYALPEMGESNRVAVDIPIKSTGNYTVTATIKVYTDDESVDPRISLYYWYDDGSVNGYRVNFEDEMLQKDGNQHEYTLSRLQTSPIMTHIKGYILNDSNRDSLYRKHALVSDIRVTYLP